jgi:putative membrane protein
MTLQTGALKISNGALELFRGVGTLRDGSKSLLTGVTDLQSGASDLNDGMNQFRTDGIEQISRLVNEDADELLESLKAVGEVSRDYNSYSGIDSSMEGSVKFIYTFEGTDSEEN